MSSEATVGDLPCYDFISVLPMVEWRVGQSCVVLSALHPFWLSQPRSQDLSSGKGKKRDPGDEVNGWQRFEQSCNSRRQRREVSHSFFFFFFRVFSLLQVILCTFSAPILNGWLVFRRQQRHLIEDGPQTQRWCKNTQTVSIACASWWIWDSRN